MINAGGLIKLHYHGNLELLEQFSDINNVLYYKGESLFKNIEISQTEHNLLTANATGLFVDGSMLERFDYHDNELYFDNVIVSREYEDTILRSTVQSLWASSPYHQLGKINLTYWFVLLGKGTRSITYQNTSNQTMLVQITNPDELLLKAKIEENEFEFSNIELTVNLPANATLNVSSTSNISNVQFKVL